MVGRRLEEMEVAISVILYSRAAEIRNSNFSNYRKPKHRNLELDVI